MRKRKTWRIIGLSLVVLLLAIQVVQPARNEHQGPFPQDISSVVVVPDEVAKTLRVSCYDCHSNNTAYPWYFKVQPVAWYLANHVEEGKGELNFDEFGSYKRRKQIHKLEEIGELVNEGEMPLSSYTLIHGDARLNESQKKIIVEWAAQAMKSLSDTL